MVAGTTIVMVTAAFTQDPALGLRLPGTDTCPTRVGVRGFDPSLGIICDSLLLQIGSHPASLENVTGFSSLYWLKARKCVRLFQWYTVTR